MFLWFLLPLKILGVPTAPSCPALVKIKSALRHICITFYAGSFTMCHCMFWSFSDSAEKVWYLHADTSLVLLPGVKSCVGYVSVFLFERFWGRDGTTEQVDVYMNSLPPPFYLTFTVKKIFYYSRDLSATMSVPISSRTPLNLAFFDDSSSFGSHIKSKDLFNPTTPSGFWADGLVCIHSCVSVYT